jgi:hypothetical protein
MSAASPAKESCDLCKAPVDELHGHLVDPVTRQIECACDACAILFGGAGQRYRRVPKRVRYLADFRMTDPQWDSLGIPVGIAFFLRMGADRKVSALYPSPAGAVESLLSLEAWQEIEAENPVVREIEPDVEGLLVYRIASLREHYIIPIDECFRLIGLVRLKWKGLSGGPALWRETTQYLETLKQRSTRRP